MLLKNFTLTLPWLVHQTLAACTCQEEIGCPNPLNPRKYFKCVDPNAEDYELFCTQEDQIFRPNLGCVNKRNPRHHHEPARSGHFWYQFDPNSRLKLDWKEDPYSPFEARVKMQITEFYPSSYFMMVGFRDGYSGIQEKHVHFSLWNDDYGDEFGDHHRDMVGVVRSDNGTEVSPFGGEGTGYKSKHDFPWTIGDTFEMKIVGYLAEEQIPHPISPETHKTWNVGAWFRHNPTSERNSKKHVWSDWQFISEYYRTGRKPFSSYFYGFGEDYRGIFDDGTFGGNKQRQAVFYDPLYRTDENMEIYDQATHINLGTSNSQKTEKHKWKTYAEKYSGKNPEILNTAHGIMNVGANHLMENEIQQKPGQVAWFSSLQQVSQEEGQTCAAQGQGICLIIETSGQSNSNSNGIFLVTAETSFGQGKSFVVEAPAKNDVLRVCDCQTNFREGEFIESVSVQATTSTDGWKVEDIKAAINPGADFNDEISPAAMASYSRWLLDLSDQSGFWVDGDDNCLNDGQPCCTNAQRCALVQDLNLEISEANGLICANDGQGICVLVETSTDTYADSSGDFGITVKTSSGKSSFFTVGNFDKGEIRKVCDCRAANTFEADETVESVEMAALNSNNGWKVMDVLIDFILGSSFTSESPEWTSQASRWLLNVTDQNGFWLDGDDNCIPMSGGEPCCTNKQTCALEQDTANGL